MKRILLLLISIVSTNIYAQYSLSGIITNKENKPIPGALVYVTGTFLGTTSDANGNYRIKNINVSEAEIEVKLIGYLSQKKRINLSINSTMNWQLEKQSYVADEVVITSTRADDKSGMTFGTLEKNEITKQNFGQDLPFLLNNQPSVVVTSDAGNGVGYTGIRVRGSDPTRINITLNGIPYNDAESHSVYWVNMPDIASSVKSIQLQRGAGSSTNGAGAFGATLNLQTNEFKGEPYASLTSSAGSFNTLRQSIELGTGLMNGFTFDLRLSKIQSDGYINRAIADLYSIFGSAAWYHRNISMRANIFTGKEKTYMAWYGVPEDSINTNRRYNPAGAYTGADGNLLYYDNQTDNYRQNHYQFFFNQQINNHLLLNVALHYTKGGGYYEEYREKDFFSNYGLPDIISGTGDTIKKSNLIRRLQMDNDFYGTVFSVSYSPVNPLKLTLGGAYNLYSGKHFGEVIWSEYAKNLPPNYQYYLDTASKTDGNIFLKTTYAVQNGLNLYADIQYRNIFYSFTGLNDLSLDIRRSIPFHFLNPKAGITWDRDDRNRFYLSFSVANREPVRADFANNIEAPKQEKMNDAELGYQLKTSKFKANATAYYMQYKNQLVLTGALNSVGYPIRMNVPESFRTGIEIELGFSPFKKLVWTGNATISRNKIRSFRESIYDENTYEESQIDYKNTDISFSPNLTASSTLTYNPFTFLNISWISKYVSKQYLDNTQSDSRMLDAFHIHSLLINFIPEYSMKPKLELGVQLNNVLNKMYAPNGYTYSGLNNGIRNDYNFYYPQAGRNFMVMLKLSF